MRLGQNPNKNTVVQPRARVVVLVITHLPSVEGYHAGRFDVVKRSFETLITNMGGLDHQLIVWDNGSSDLLIEWLVKHGIHKFVLSENVGKTNALKSIMRMLPPDTILAYGDDDIEYFPNWLAPQIEILETYPNVGVVTGWPVRIASKWGEKSVEKLFGDAWGKPKVQINSPFGNWLIETGRFIPDEWERDYCESVGRNYTEYAMSTNLLADTRITYKGIQTYATSQHCQFVCYPCAWSE